MGDLVGKRDLEEPSFDNEQSAKVPKLDFSCSICREIMYDPRAFSCGHSFCFLCYFKMRKPIIRCPDCRSEQTTPCQRNHSLRKLIESSDPIEYAKRKEACVVEEWLEKKNLGICIVASTKSPHVILRILHVLDKLNVWEMLPDQQLLDNTFSSPGAYIWTNGPAAYAFRGVNYFRITWKEKSCIFGVKDYETDDWLK